MTPYVQKTDYEVAAGDLLTGQMRKTVATALAKVFAKQIQDFENAAAAVFSGRTIDSAIGKQLDGLGALVGEARNGLDDDTYRLRIRARIKLNISSGTPDEIIDLFKLLTAAGTVPTITEYQPAFFVLSLEGTSATESVATGEELGRILQKAKPAGVGANLTYSTAAGTNTFYWNGTAAQGWNAGEWAHSAEG
jgi:hypothetical protein